MNRKISFIGGGNMAEALIRGMIEGARFRPSDILVCEPREDRRTHLAGSHAVSVSADNREAADWGKIAVLAVKPQTLPAVASDLAGLKEDQLLISILAGVTTGLLEGIVGKAIAVVRAMPNTPALVRAGATALCAGACAREEHLRQAEEILGSVGKVVRVPEKMMNAVTALSGSGPAYFYLFCDYLSSVGRDLGLEKADAELLARETLVGAGRLIDAAGESPSVLRGRVTSPGGTTEAALKVLERGELLALLDEALRAASRRGEELGERMKEISGRPKTQ
jgi:pyrroline-5-carboxylate reductase